MRRKKGIYDGISDKEYHSDKDQVSSSQIRMIVQPGGPAKVKHHLTNPQEDTAAFLVGRAAHTLVLGEGSPVIPLPEEVGKTLAGKKAKDFIADHPDETVLTQADYEMVTGMAEAVLANPDARELLEQPGKAEQSVYWKDELTGVQCKCRPDFLPEATPGFVCAFVDYKTTADASPEGFARSVTNFGYAQAAAFYAQGLRNVKHVQPGDDAQMWFIVQEKKPPYLTGVYTLDVQDVKKAQTLNDYGLSLWKECKKTGEWPGYETQIIGLKPWAWNQFEERGIEL